MFGTIFGSNKEKSSLLRKGSLSAKPYLFRAWTYVRNHADYLEQQHGNLYLRVA